ncbi:MAG: type II toxin-antitoxin system HicA family toxin [Bacteroidota bacterium]
MAILPVISGKELVSILEKESFEVARIKGSHCLMKHPDGRITTVPVHKNMDLPKRPATQNYPARYSTPHRGVRSVTEITRGDRSL